jgi:hypothetical protein
MNDDEDNFTRAVAAWKHRHRIRDDDPMLASLELLELFFQNVRIQIPDSGTATIAEVRAAIQQLDRLAKDFSKQTRELVLEFRNAPQHKPRGHANWWALATICLIAGAVIGKFFL